MLVNTGMQQVMVDLSPSAGGWTSAGRSPSSTSTLPGVSPPSLMGSKPGEDPLWQRRAPGRLQLQSLRLDQLPSAAAPRWFDGDAVPTHPPHLGNVVMPGIGMQAFGSSENLAALQWQQQQQQQHLEHQHLEHQHQQQQQIQYQHQQQHQQMSYQHLYLQPPPPQMGTPLMNPAWSEFKRTVYYGGETGSDDSRKRRKSASFEVSEAKRMFMT